MIAAIVLAAINTPALVWVLPVAAVVVLVIMAVLVPQIDRAYSRRQERLDALNNRLQENLTGVRVVKASTGSEGLRLARTLRPAAITLDVVMPGMDGWAVLRDLKLDAATRNIPVIMVTMTDDQEAGYALGATEFLTKPIDRGELVQILERHASISGARTALIVEDLAEDREVMRRALEQENWQAMTAVNGRDGLEQLAGAKVSLILLDLMMPVMDGFDFVLEVRKSPVWRGIPIVVVTAKDLTEEDRSRLNGDVVALIQKSGMDQESLLAQVREQLAAIGSGG